MTEGGIPPSRILPVRQPCPLARYHGYRHVLGSGRLRWCPRPWFVLGRSVHYRWMLRLQGLRCLQVGFRVRTHRELPLVCVSDIFHSKEFGTGFSCKRGTLVWDARQNVSERFIPLKLQRFANTKQMGQFFFIKNTTMRFLTVYGYI